VYIGVVGYIGGLSFEVREFFRETSSETVPVDLVTPESPDNDVIAETSHNTSSMTSCRHDVRHSPASRTTAAAAATAAVTAGDNEAGRSASHKHASSSTSSAPSTWIAFKVRLVLHLVILSPSIYRYSLSNIYFTA